MSRAQSTNLSFQTLFLSKPVMRKRKNLSRIKRKHTRIQQWTIIPIILQLWKRWKNVGQLSDRSTLKTLKRSRVIQRMQILPFQGVTHLELRLLKNRWLLLMLVWTNKSKRAIVMVNWIALARWQLLIRSRLIIRIKRRTSPEIIRNKFRN